MLNGIDFSVLETYYVHFNPCYNSFGIQVFNLVYKQNIHGF